MRGKTFLFFVLFLFFAGLYPVTVAYAEEKKGYEVKQVVVTVDGKPVTRDDLYTEMIQTYPSQAKSTINKLINRILIEKEAKLRKMKISDKQIKERAEELGITKELSSHMKSMIETSLLMEKMLIADKGVKVTNDEIKKFFDENKEKLGEPEQVRLKQIYVKTEDDANDVIIALTAGADFSKMARAKSQDVSTRERGGDLGVFTRGTILPEIETVVFSLPEGDVSPPLKSRDGFHIIKVVERIEAKQPQYDSSMRKKIKDLLMDEKMKDAMPGWIDALRSQAEIKY
ncbi:MAG: peptidylprolyl isomerase [Endomicrobiales bacterium]|nr:peptidylprolyl isomerase [Endomicrobiales bacterium]